MTAKTTGQAIAERDFSRTTVKALAKLGITLVGAQWLPGEDGTYVNGETGYNLDDNGTHKVRRFMDVLTLAK